MRSPERLVTEWYKEIAESYSEQEFYILVLIIPNSENLLLGVAIPNPPPLQFIRTASTTSQGPIFVQYLPVKRYLLH